MSERGRKRSRISRSGDFDRVYRDGSSAANRFLVLYSFPRDEGPGGDPRLGISVGRKIGGAVVRNKVKRRLREAFWDLDQGLPPGSDFVIVARPGVEDLVEREGTEGLRKSLVELLSNGDSDTATPTDPDPADDMSPEEDR